MLKQSCHLLEYVRTTCCQGNDVSSADLCQYSRAQAIWRAHAKTQQLSLRRISSVFSRVIAGSFPSHLPPAILTRSPVQCSHFSGKKLPQRKANCSAVDGFLAGGGDSGAGWRAYWVSDVARGGCLFSRNFSVTRSTVLTEACRCCISDSLLPYSLEIPLGRNRALHYAWLYLRRRMYA